MSPAYATLRDLSVTEMGVSILLMREPASDADELATLMGRWFGLDLARDDLERCFERLVAKGWLIRDDDGRHSVPRTVEQTVYRALGGLVRIIDRDRGIWDAAAVLRLVQVDIRRGIN